MATAERDDILELDNESHDDISALKCQIIRLNKENECYKQDIHSLQSKIRIELGIRNELHETIDNFERAIEQIKHEMNKRIADIEEKNAENRNELLLRLNEKESEAEEKSQIIQKLQQNLKDMDKLLTLANAEQTSKDLTVRDESISHNSEQVQELIVELLQEKDARKRLEETINAMMKEESELKEILHVTKVQLAEQMKMLETTRDELNECRMQLETLKNIPASGNSKGNSLFAEVEDRRKKLYDRMVELKQHFYEAKRCVHNKDNEIKVLKSELAALLNKQKIDADECAQENGELLDKYKDRILELENKLSEQQKKYRKLEIQKQPTDNSFGYFQSLLDTKRKEIEGLEMKLGKLSMQSLIQEDIKKKVNSEMRYWRDKAMSYEAKIVAIKSSLDTDKHIHSSMVNKKLLAACEHDINSTLLSEDVIMDLSEKSPTIIDETVITLDELIKIPELPIQTTYNEERNESEDLLTTSMRNISFASNELDGLSSEIKKSEDKDIIIHKHLNSQKCVGNIKVACTSENITIDNNHGIKKQKETKVLRFAEGTVDHEPRKLLRQNAPKYPILYVPKKSED